MAVNREGKEIISCSMTKDTRKYGPCATCYHDRDWRNCRDIHEGEPGYCDDPNAVTAQD